MKTNYSEKLVKLMKDIRISPEKIKNSDIKSLNEKEQGILSKYLSELMIEASSMKREEQIKN